MSNLPNGQQLPVFSEADNTHDRRAVAVYKDGSVVGHVPPDQRGLQLECSG